MRQYAPITKLRFVVTALALCCAPQSALAQTSLHAAVSSAAEHGFRGVVLLGDQRRILFQEAVGNADDETGAAHRVGEIWPWASVTKQVTAVLIMQEVQRGRLSLDTTIAQALPAFTGLSRGAVTVKQLLQHTSGLPNPDGGPVDPANGAPSFYLRSPAPQREASDALGFCASAPAANPGERFDYNNCDYIVLGAILERLNHRSFAQLVAQRIAAPAGLQTLRVAPRRRQSHRDVAGYVHGRQAPPFNEATFGASGALFGSPYDLLAFDRALMSGVLLRRAALETLWRGDASVGYVALGAWSFSAPLLGCAAPVQMVERRGAIGGVQVRNIIAPAIGRALIVFANDADIEFGEIWQGAGLSYELASASFCQGGEATSAEIH